MYQFLLYPLFYLLDYRNVHKFNAEESNHLLNTCGVNRGVDVEWKDKVEIILPWIVRIVNYEGRTVPLTCGGVLISDRHILTLSKCILRRGDNVRIERHYATEYGMKKEEYSVIHHLVFRPKALAEGTATIVLLEVSRIKIEGENVDETSNFINTACLGFNEIDLKEKDIVDVAWLRFSNRSSQIGRSPAEVKGVRKRVMCGSPNCDTTYEMKPMPGDTPGSPLIKRARVYQEDGSSSFKPYVIGLTLDATHVLSILPYTANICFHIGLCRDGGGEDYSLNGEVIVAQNLTEPATFPVSTE